MDAVISELSYGVSLFQKLLGWSKILGTTFHSQIGSARPPFVGVIFLILN